MIISTVAQWVVVSASGVLINVDSTVEEEWRSCSKCPLLGASVTQVGVTYRGFLLNSPPLLNSQRLLLFLFRGPATSLRVLY